MFKLGADSLVDFVFFIYKVKILAMQSVDSKYLKLLKKLKLHF